MDKKKLSRIKRGKNTRCKLYKLNKIRLVIHRTSNHIYAQIIDSNNNKILTSASTVEKKIKKNIQNTGNKKTAYLIGKLIAERALKNGIQSISFDRSGFKYHGRVKALAEAARESGLKF